MINSKLLLKSLLIPIFCLQACQKSAENTPSLNETVTAEAAPTLEELVESNDLEAFAALARKQARKTTPRVSLSEVGEFVRSNDTIYWPEGAGPFPAVLFFHGCSGRTVSHEIDWAKRYNDIGIALISVDSLTGRNLEWDDVCNLKKLLPWERANDVLSTIDFAKTHEKIKGDALYLSGFSHGAMTVWATLGFASTQTAPIGLDKWPDTGLDGVQGAFLFYGSCMGDWDVNIDTTLFLGRDDLYIDEAGCEAYLETHPDTAGPLKVTIFDKATHTFDHATPNASNVEAGSIYDEAATLASWDRIQDVIRKSNTK